MDGDGVFKYKHLAEKRCESPGSQHGGLQGWLWLSTRVWNTHTEERTRVTSLHCDTTIASYRQYISTVGQLSTGL